MSNRRRPRNLLDKTARSRRLETSLIHAAAETAGGLDPTAARAEAGILLRECTRAELVDVLVGLANRLGTSFALAVRLDPDLTVEGILNDIDAASHGKG